MNLIVKLAFSMGAIIVGGLITLIIRERRMNARMRNAVLVSKFDGDDETICSICYEDLEFGENQVKLPCKHRFHKSCIMREFENKMRYRRTCPLCRCSVSEEFISKLSHSYVGTSERSFLY